MHCSNLVTLYMLSDKVDFYRLLSEREHIVFHCSVNVSKKIYLFSLLDACSLF